MRCMKDVILKLSTYVCYCIINMLPKPLCGSVVTFVGDLVEAAAYGLNEKKMFLSQKKSKL